MQRRRFLQTSAAAALAPRGMSGNTAYTAQMPDMLLSHLSRRLNALAGKWDTERSKITTAADVESRNRFVREKLREMVHGFPKRNSLNPIVVSKFDRADYRVENVMFQSRPDFWVTGNLYIPTKSS